MKAIRLTDEARAAVNDAFNEATKAPTMTRAEEVRALMGKGMKMVTAQGHVVWAHAPRKIAELTGAPYIAALPGLPDLAEYLAAGGKLVAVPT